MLPKVSKGFRAIFVAVMCVVCVALCVLAVRLAQQGEQLRLTQLQLDASLARLKLQQTQRAQIDIDLPETLAQLQAVQPEADAASGLPRGGSGDELGGISADSAGSAGHPEG